MEKKLVTRTWKVYGAEGHRQNLQESCENLENAVDYINEAIE